MTTNEPGSSRRCEECAQRISRHNPFVPSDEHLPTCSLAMEGEPDTFNREYVELMTLGANSVTDMLGDLARDHRQTGRVYAERGDALLASSFRASALAYEHALSMIDLAWDQAMSRVARQASA